MGGNSSSKGTIVIAVVSLLIVGGIFASNFVGPKAGWLDSLMGKENKANDTSTEIVIKDRTKPQLPSTTPEIAKVAQPEQPAAPAPPTDTATPGQPEKKTDLTALYDSLLAKYQKKLAPPKVGKNYKLYLKSGSIIQGVLAEVTPGKVVLKQQYGSMTYPINVVSPRSYKTFFPERAAKIYALKEFDKLTAPKEPVKPVEPLTTPPKGETDVASAAPTPVKTYTGRLKYDLEKGKTPENIKGTVQHFATWLTAQQRRMGGRVAQSLHAKQQGNDVVLYLYTSKLFQKQDYDFRFVVSEGMWKLWSIKCMENGLVNGAKHAHLVIVGDNNKIIGGSTTKDATDIWAKR